MIRSWMLSSLIAIMMALELALSFTTLP